MRSSQHLSLWAPYHLEADTAWHPVWQELLIALPIKTIYFWGQGGQNFATSAHPTLQLLLYKRNFYSHQSCTDAPHPP